MNPHKGKRSPACLDADGLADKGGSSLYLHLIAADPKFLGPITRMFEAAAPGLHEYVVVGSVEVGWVLPDGIVHAADGPAAAAVAASRDDWDGVLVHGLRFVTARPIMEALTPSVAVAWYVWGYEAYEAWPALQRGLLLPETRSAVARLSGSPAAAIARKAWRAWRWDDPHDVVNRYDYCVTQIREEYDLFVTTGLLTTTRFAWGSVGALEDYAAMSASRCVGQDIQVGNSASNTSNHLDAFDALSCMDLGRRRVVVPLGYGDSRYRAMVNDEGRRRLGERFHPLEAFLPLEEYLSVMRRCGHVVMNHCRQQALGSIIDALWRGARVYLNDTTVYRALRRQGFEISLVSETLGEGRMLEPMTHQQTRLHRELLLARLGQTRVTTEAIRLLGVLRAGRSNAQ